MEDDVQNRESAATRMVTTVSSSSKLEVKKKKPLSIRSLEGRHVRGVVGQKGPTQISSRGNPVSPALSLRRGGKLEEETGEVDQTMKKGTGW